MIAFTTALAVTVSVAASLADVVTDLAARYRAATGVRVQVNAGPSNTLARQIVEGAPVDIFISADETQMAVIEQAGRLVQGTRTSLLSNQLVLIAPSNGAATMHGPSDLRTEAIRRIAIGQPDSVPAGVYGRQWLEKLGLWNAVKSKMVPLPSVRATLAAVREGRADAGIVYATDAKTTDDVRVVYSVPADEGPPIRYPAAVVNGPHTSEAAAFLRYLQSAEARATFEAAGFIVLAGR